MTRTTGLEAAEGRLLRWMVGAGVLATLVALAMGEPRFAAGIALGAVLALVNYYWLHQAVMHLMRAGEERLPRLLVVKFILRYPLAIGCVYLLYRTGWVSLPGLFAGLFVPVAGVVAEGALQIREGLRRS